MPLHYTPIEWVSLHNIYRSYANRTDTPRDISNSVKKKQKSLFSQHLLVFFFFKNYIFKGQPKQNFSTLIYILSKNKWYHLWVCKHDRIRFAAAKSRALRPGPGQERRAASAFSSTTYTQTDWSNSGSNVYVEFYWSADVCTTLWYANPFCLLS